jgi:hypothetical protein
MHSTSTNSATPKIKNSMLSPTFLAADLITPRGWLVDDQNLHQPNAADVLFPSNHATGYCTKETSSYGSTYYQCKEDPAREPWFRSADREIEDSQDEVAGSAVGVAILSLGLLSWISAIMFVGVGLLYVPRAFLWPIRVIGERFRADSDCAVKPLLRTSAHICVE